MKWPWWFPFASVPEIGACDLALRLHSEPRPFLLDVRTVLEWQKSHIEGAVNVPIAELPSWNVSDHVTHPESSIVVICRSAHRSVPGVRLLQRQGYTKAVQLAGGMRAWWAAGLSAVSVATA